LPNPLDWKLRAAARRGSKRVLLGWNRGLGDIPLGLYAIVHRIRQFIPNAEIAFATRPNLIDGFSMLEGVQTIPMPHWERGKPYRLEPSLCKQYDLVIGRPSPTDWCRWQRGSLCPKLRWNPEHDLLYRRFDLPDDFTYIGVQVVAETQYGLWRNWPEQCWRALFDRLAEMGGVRVLLFGYGAEPHFPYPHLIDLRGKTTLPELLSIIQNKCHGLVLPDSGIAAMTYYLEQTFSLRMVTLWADPNHGILKQATPSPNPDLQHIPLIAPGRDLGAISAEQVCEALFPKRARTGWSRCVAWDPDASGTPENAALVILAGGQGTRLGYDGPKGTFHVLGKSLFQWIVQKAPPSMPIAVMTSPLNHQETVQFFAEKHNFGRDIWCFEQTVLPLLDAQYRPVFAGPDGNGCVFQRLVATGWVERMRQQGVDTVVFLPVDNPLADPADGAWIGRHRRQNSDLTVKCIRRAPREAGLGLLVEEEGRLAVVEYVDLTRAEIDSPAFAYAYIGQFAASLSFIERAAQVDLPLHWIRKQGLWKRERFVFDAFVAATRAEAICYPREICYAPLKSREQLAAVEQALRGIR
jgi:ADP-heptose:LPS heptosyltransferase